MFQCYKKFIVHISLFLCYLLFPRGHLILYRKSCLYFKILRVSSLFVLEIFILFLALKGKNKLCGHIRTQIRISLYHTIPFRGHYLRFLFGSHRLRTLLESYCLCWGFIDFLLSRWVLILPWIFGCKVMYL